MRDYTEIASRACGAVLYATPAVEMRHRVSARPQSAERPAGCHRRAPPPPAGPAGRRAPAAASQLGSSRHARP
eukprot:1579384-Prymnesium_polylepis.1